MFHHRHRCLSLLPPLFWSPPFKLNHVSVMRSQGHNHRKKNHVKTRSVASAIYRRSLVVVSHWAATFLANLKSLIDIAEGYNLGGTGLPCTHSPTFSTSCPHFPLVAPSGLQFNQVLTTRSKCWVLENLWPPRGLSTTWQSTVAYICA
jgi:hypothetical protein